MQAPGYRELLSRTLIALALGVAAVSVCYVWVDSPVAYAVHGRGINHLRVFRWLTYPPPLVQSWSPLLLVLLIVRRAWRPFEPWQRVLLVSCLSLLVADQFRTSLGDLCGRYWPETWFDDNPSLIGSGTYGFRPFALGDDTGSFPSGHAARVMSFAVVWWLAMPQTRLLWMLLCPPLLASLVAMNYHFVGDVAGGSIVGALVAMYASRLGGVAPPFSPHDSIR